MVFDFLVWPPWSPQATEGEGAREEQREISGSTWNKINIQCIIIIAHLLYYLPLKLNEDDVEKIGVINGLYY